MKRLGIAVGIIVIGGLAYYFLKDKNHESPQPPLFQVVNEYPHITITKSDGSQVSLDELKVNNVIVFFHYDCDHCQREAKAIIDNLNSFDEYQLFFISNNDFNLMNSFASEYGLANKANVIIGRTTAQDIMNNLGHISAPSLYVFRDGKLIKHLDGEKDIEEILKYI
jgi:peroxiredoxin